MRDIWKVTEEMKTALEKCHNCGGELKQRRAWSLECETCGHRYNVETLRQRYAFWGIMVFLAGATAGLFLTILLAAL